MEDLALDPKGYDSHYCDQSEWHEMFQKDWHSFSWWNRGQSNEMIDNVLSQNLCLTCTMNILLDNFVTKWRKHINSYGNDSYKIKVIDCLKKTIEKLKQEQEAGAPRYCGCSDFEYADNENRDWEFYIEQGPGYTSEEWIDDDNEGYIMLAWNLTPDVTPDQFETTYYQGLAEWRHDNLMLRMNMEKNLEYLESTLHKTYKDTAVSMASSKLPTNCVNLVMSYL